MKQHDPAKLLREAVTAARADTPTPAKLAKLAARLPLGVPPPPVASGAVPAAASVPTTLSGVLIGSALGALVWGTALFHGARHEAPPPASGPQAVLIAASSNPPRATPDAPRIEPAIASPREAPRAPSNRPPPAQAAASVVAAAPPHESPGELAQTNESSGAFGPAETETEAHLLQRAMDALSTDPARALALTQEHVSRFPGGPLAQEREVVAIQALLRLGQAGEARARWARFIAVFPQSAHRRRIEALLGP